MSDQWKKRADAVENEYFDIQEKAALERLAKRNTEQQRLSPVSGKPMIQKTINGVVIDQCQETGGIWLDAGELEQIMKVFSDNHGGLIEKFFANVFGKK
jgi:Transcription factor zinc-finger